MKILTKLIGSLFRVSYNLHPGSTINLKLKNEEVISRKIKQTINYKDGFIVIFDDEIN